MIYVFSEIVSSTNLATNPLSSDNTLLRLFTDIPPSDAESAMKFLTAEARCHGTHLVQPHSFDSSRCRINYKVVGKTVKNTFSIAV
jgi:hypothetical protein